MRNYAFALRPPSQYLINVMRERPPLVAYCTRSTLVICSALLNPAPGSPAASPINVSSPAVGSASPVCSMATSTRSGKSETITRTVGSPFAWPSIRGNVSRHASSTAEVSPCWPASDKPQRCDECCTTAAIAPKSRILYCDWQKQQNFSQVHCDSGLSHCEQSVSTVAASGSNTRLFRSAHSRTCATQPQAPCTARFPASQTWIRCTDGRVQRK